MSAVIETKVIEIESKESKVQEIKDKTENLFTGAREFIANSVSKEEITSTIKLVAAGIKHIIQLSWYMGVAIGGMIVEYIMKFIAWIGENVNKATAKFAKKQLEDAAK